MIISISGTAGSGKSTVGEKLAKELNWPRYYIGGLRREAAKKRGITLQEYNKLGEADPATDKEVDEYQKELGKTKDNFVIEGRTSWYFIPHSLKIYLDVDETEGAKRVLGALQKPNKRNEDKEINTLEEAVESTRKRKETDIKRYKKYYNIDAYDPANYDFVLDTTKLTPEEAFEKIYTYIKTKIN